MVKEEEIAINEEITEEINEPFDFYKPVEDENKEYKLVNQNYFLVNKPVNVDTEEIVITDLLKKYKLSIYFKEVDEKEIYSMVEERGISLVDGCLLNPNDRLELFCDNCRKTITGEYKYYINKRSDCCLDCNEMKFEFGTEIDLVDTVWWDVDDGYYTLYRKKGAKKGDTGKISLIKPEPEPEPEPETEEIEEAERTDSFFEELDDFTEYEIEYVQPEEIQIRHRNRYYLINNTNFGSLYDWKPLFTEITRISRIVWININKDSKLYKRLAISFNKGGVQFFTLQEQQTLEWLLKFLKNKKQRFSFFNICSLSTFKDYYKLQLVDVNGDGCSIM